MCCKIPTTIKGDAHAYTRSSTPWILVEPKSAYGKLIHYLSGGGMRAFGRTVRQEEIRQRHIGAWIAFGVFLALWLAFLIF